ncbi:MAG: hypothetical protein ABR569_05710 [Gaiellaceae bacterium]
MKVIVLGKQVPRPNSISFDEETKALRREGVPLDLNSFDTAAIELAARLRDTLRGVAVAMTKGPPQAEAALRVCRALGADRSIHRCDRVFAVADVALVADWWQLPPELHEALGSRL